SHSLIKKLNYLTMTFCPKSCKRFAWQRFAPPGTAFPALSVLPNQASLGQKGRIYAGNPQIYDLDGFRRK
ncbi:hypothetical protein, partial [Emergencia sp.]|uniref:hypothetical protein n=1 Tax=Emergencia sp. TaxID=1926557 RepID=UPI003AF114B3